MVIVYLTGISQMCSSMHAHVRTHTHPHTTKILKDVQRKCTESEHQAFQIPR